MEKIQKFWQWFVDHNEQLVAMGDLEDKERQELCNALQYQLTKYCDGLTYEIGDATANGRALTFTAEGDTDLFRYVVELVDNAPDLDWWEFVAFKQPMGTELKVRFDNLLFDTRKMYFQQLECEEEPDMLGLRIAVEDGQRQDEDFQVGVPLSSATWRPSPCPTNLSNPASSPSTTSPNSSTGSRQNATSNIAKAKFSTFNFQLSIFSYLCILY